MPLTPSEPEGRDDPVIGVVTASAFTIPTDQPEADGTLAWDATTVVVVSATAQGMVGMGWTYSDRAAATVVDSLLASEIEGASALDVGRLHDRMVRAVRNVGGAGVAAAALSAVDVALWDLKARLVDLPLAVLFGRHRSEVPVYGSGGFTTYDDATTRRQLEGWIGEDGVRHVKIKIGEGWGTRQDRDRHRVHLTRETVGPTVEVFVDANGAFSAHQAVRLGRELSDKCGITWYEEPVSSDDLAGLREVRRHLSVDVTAGEYGWNEPYFAQMLAADAVDCLQIDVTRCGGFTSWLRIASLASARNLEVSGHCAPNLHAHVAASVPNLRHVELFHDHRRADALLFDGLPVMASGALVPDPEARGHGMLLKSADAAPYRVA